jgi:hypothetical protein
MSVVYESILIWISSNLLLAAWLVWRRVIVDRDLQWQRRRYLRVIDY